MVSDFWTPLYVHVKDSLHAPQQRTMQINSCFLYFFCISSKYKERRQWRRASAKKELKRIKEEKCQWKKKTYKKKFRGNPYTEAVRRRHYISLWGRETDAAKLWMKRGLSFHLGQPFGVEEKRRGRHKTFYFSKLF